MLNRRTFQADSTVRVQTIVGTILLSVWPLDECRDPRGAVTEDNIGSIPVYDGENQCYVTNVNSNGLVRLESDEHGRLAIGPNDVAFPLSPVRIALAGVLLVIRVRFETHD